MSSVLGKSAVLVLAAGALALGGGPRQDGPRQEPGAAPGPLPRESDARPRADRRAGGRTPAPPPRTLPEIDLPRELPTPTPGPDGLTPRPLVLPHGRVRYASEVQVPAPAAGRLVEVLVREGDEVKAGDRLGRIDDEEARLEAELKGLAAANDAAVEAAKARAAWHKHQYDTSLRLTRSGGVSAEEVEGRRQQWLAAEHDLRHERSKRDQADADHEKAQAALGRHVVASPIAGVVRERRRQPHEAVQALEPVFHVVGTDRMRVEGEFDQRHLGRLARGTPVEVWPERVQGEVDRVTHPAAVWAVRFLSGGRRLAFAGADGAIVVWDYAARRRERVLRASAKPVRALAAVPGAPALLLAGDDGGLLRAWDLARGAEAREGVRVAADGAAVTALEADPGDPSAVYVGLASGVVQRWDWRRGAAVKTFAASGRRAAHVNQVTSLALSPDRRLLLSAADDRTAAVWPALGDGEPLVVGGRDAPPDKEVRQLNFSPTGDLFPLPAFGVLQPRRAADGLPAEDVERPGGRAPFVWLAAFAPEPGLLVTAREAGDLELWRLAAGRPPRLARLLAGHDKERAVRRVDFAEGGRLMASCGDDRTARLWRLPTAAELDAERLPGAVLFVSPQVEPGTGVVRFLVEAANRAGVLTANARATVVAHPRP